MALFDRMSRESFDPHEPAVVFDETGTPVHNGNLARGIVWADVLAEIAADERTRGRGLPDAA